MAKVTAQVESIVFCGDVDIVVYEYAGEDGKKRRSVVEVKDPAEREKLRAGTVRLGQEVEIDEPIADNPG